MEAIKNILDTIDNAIAKFQNAIPGIQKLMYDELQPLIKQFDIRDGNLLNNVKNLKLIGDVQNKLEKIIISADYKTSVNDFVDAFSMVSNLQQEYFKQFNQQYKPKKTLPIIKQLAIESTINDLVGQGLNANVIAPIKSILNQNITTGGSYVNFLDQLQNHILNNDTGEGSLERYTKQITTDAIHQYNAQYHDAIAQDLNFNWGRYVGSNITTSRELCILLTKKQWVKREELPEIIKGHIDGHDCKLSKTTGLPLGMIPGTNVDNFKIYRGGYNCGHQFFWVPDSAVPEYIKAGTQTNFVAKKIEEVKHNLTDDDIKKLKEDANLTLPDLINLTGGIPGEGITNIRQFVYHDPSRGAISSKIITNQYDIERKIYYDEKTIYNSYMDVKDKGQGIGLNLFLNQVKEARAQGFKELRVSAAGNADTLEDWNGYITWGKFGYEMNKYSKEMFTRTMNEYGRKEKDLFQLLSTKEGTEFWTDHGRSWDGTFDLTDNSTSMKNLTKYLEGKKIIVKL